MRAPRQAQRMGMALALLLTGVGCLFDLGGAPAGEAKLISMEPSQGVAVAPQNVVIRGKGLRPLLSQDFSRAQGLVVDATFVAWLDEVELQEVQLVEEDRLQAVVPGALAAGVYDLRVQTPQGKTLLLEQAYEVLLGQLIAGISPADLVNDAAAELKVRGSNFADALQLDLIDNEGQITPLDLLRHDAQEIVATVPAGLAAGSYQVQVRQGERSDSASQELRVWDPARLSLELGASVSVLAIGANVDLRVRVFNSGGSVSKQVTIDPPVLAGSGSLTHLGGPEPATADIAPGSSRLFVFTYQAEATGVVGVELRARGLNDFSQRTNLSPGKRIEIAVQRPARLSAQVEVSPTMVAVGANITVAVRVDNTGEGRALSVVPEVVADVADRVQQQSGPVPVGAHLAPAQQASFVFVFESLSAGPVQFVASASGSDEASAQTLYAAPVTSTVVHVQ